MVGKKKSDRNSLSGLWIYVTALINNSKENIPHWKLYFLSNGFREYCCPLCKLILNNSLISILCVARGMYVWVSACKTYRRVSFPISFLMSSCYCCVSLPKPHLSLTLSSSPHLIFPLSFCNPFISPCSAIPLRSLQTTVVSF